jgi:hypothetical protein
MSMNTTEFISTMKTDNDSSDGNFFVGVFWGISLGIPLWILIFLAL